MVAARIAPPMELYKELIIWKDMSKVGGRFSGE